MKYANISNGKIIGIMSMKVDGLVPVPDDTRLGDIYNDVTGEVAEDPNAWRNAKIKEIGSAFASELSTGVFTSASLGINVDCRRSNTKNDYQNVQGLLSRMNREGIESVTYIGVSELVTATKAQIQALLYEMEDHVAALYAKKWALEAQIEAATTADELAQITW